MKQPSPINPKPGDLMKFKGAYYLVQQISTNGKSASWIKIPWYVYWLFRFCKAISQ